MTINPLDRIQSYYEDLTKTDKDIAIYIFNHPQDAARSPISVTAKKAKTSKSALVRFSNRIGYSGFAEFKFDLSRFLVSQNIGSEESASETDPVEAITETYADYIRQIRQYISREDLRLITDHILHAKRIKILGYNRTFNSALQLRQRFAKIGIDAEAVGDTALMDDLPYILGENDLMIIFTISDNGGFYTEIAKTAAGNHCPVLCFTMTQALPLKKACAGYYILPRVSRDSSISFLDDQAIYFVFIELILDAVASKTRKQ